MEYADIAPFRIPVVDSEFTARHPRIKAFGGRGDLLVRVLDNKEYVMKGATHPNFVIADGLFEECRKDFGIAIPNYQVIEVIKPDEERAVFYTPVDRVYGRNLLELLIAERDTEELHPEVDALYVSLVSYAEKKYQTGGYYLNDLAMNRQYVYGRVDQNEEKKLYFVDLDPHFSFFDPTDLSSSGSDHFFSGFVFQMFLEAMKAEEWIGRRLNRAREKFETFFRLIPQDIPFYETRIKVLLEGLEETKI